MGFDFVSRGEGSFGEDTRVALILVVFVGTFCVLGIQKDLNWWESMATPMGRQF